LSRVLSERGNNNVDYPDLTREFIGTIVQITHNRYNTLSRLIAHKRESSNITIADSALVFLSSRSTNHN
jgi:hypothetical protein